MEDHFIRLEKHNKIKQSRWSVYSTCLLFMFGSFTSDSKVCAKANSGSSFKNVALFGSRDRTSCIISQPFFENRHSSSAVRQSKYLIALLKPSSLLWSLYFCPAELIISQLRNLEHAMYLHAHLTSVRLCSSLGFSCGYSSFSTASHLIWAAEPDTNL